MYAGHQSPARIDPSLPGMRCGTRRVGNPESTWYHRGRTLFRALPPRPLRVGGPAYGGVPGPAPHGGGQPVLAGTPESTYPSTPRRHVVAEPHRLAKNRPIHWDEASTVTFVVRKENKRGAARPGEVEDVAEGASPRGGMAEPRLWTWSRLSREHRHHRRALSSHLANRRCSGVPPYDDPSTAMTAASWVGYYITYRRPTRGCARTRPSHPQVLSAILRDEDGKWAMGEMGCAWGGGERYPPPATARRVDLTGRHPGWRGFGWSAVLVPARRGSRPAESIGAALVAPGETLDSMLQRVREARARYAAWLVSKAHAPVGCAAGWGTVDMVRPSTCGGWQESRALVGPR